MATTAQVLKAALQEILVQGSEAPLEADEYQDAIFAMNNYLTALDANGVHLGYTIVSNLSDEVTVPAGALQGIISNVAILMAPQFMAPISPALIAKAKMGLKAMRKLGITILPTQFPSTMPIGAGNQYEGDDSTLRFYPGTDNEVLTETGQGIQLETIPQ